MNFLIIGYLILLSLYSFLFIRKSHSEAGYFVCSRELKTVPLAFTLAATTIGGSAVVVTYALIKRYGAVGILPDVAGGLGLMVTGYFLADKIRNTEVITLPSLLKPWMKRHWILLLTVVIVSAQLAWLALSFKSLQMVGGLSRIEVCTVAFLAFVYSCSGGQWAVSKSDLFQFLLMVAGFAVTFFIVEGRTAVVWSLPDIYLVYIILLMFFSHIVGPDIYSKIFSGADGATVRKGTVLAGCLKIGFSILILLAFTGNVSLEKLNWILFIGIASAILSSIDSIIISSSAIIQKDILQKDSVPGLRYLTGGGMVLLSVILTLYSKEVVSLLAAGYTIFLAGLFFPVLSSLLLKRPNSMALFLPLAVFLASWFFIGKESAFMVSFFTGGILIAGQKIYSR